MNKSYQMIITGGVAVGLTAGLLAEKYKTWYNISITSGKGLYCYWLGT